MVSFRPWRSVVLASRHSDFGACLLRIGRSLLELDKRACPLPPPWLDIQAFYFGWA